MKGGGNTKSYKKNQISVAILRETKYILRSELKHLSNCRKGNQPRLHK